MTFINIILLCAIITYALNMIDGIADYKLFFWSALAKSFPQIVVIIFLGKMVYQLDAIINLM